MTASLPTQTHHRDGIPPEKKHLPPFNCPPAEREGGEREDTEKTELVPVSTYHGHQHRNNGFDHKPGKLIRYDTYTWHAE